MKISILILFFYLSQNLNCQVINSDDLPFKIIGNRTVALPENYYKVNMKGFAYVILIIDKNCNLVNFSISSINLKDSAGNNVVKYYDASSVSIIVNSKYGNFNKEYYPVFIRDLYDRINALVKKLKLEYGNIDIIKDNNPIGVRIQIE